MNNNPIDRICLIQRHNPNVTEIDPFQTLSVGNGEFAFSVDATGLQTFATEFAPKFPLCTVSHWAWHTQPARNGLDVHAIQPKLYETYGRSVGYLIDKTGQEEAYDWLRQNPHRLHLGQIGLALRSINGNPATPNDLKQIHQTLDLWTGTITSRFEFDGKPVTVTTCAHPHLDMIAVRIASPLIDTGQLQIQFAFPYGSPEMAMADWNSPHSHQTSLERIGAHNVLMWRQLDADAYCVQMVWSPNASLTQTSDSHTFLLGSKGNQLEFVCLFSPHANQEALPTVSQTLEASRAHWMNFWNTGGVLDLSDSTDARAEELERRIVLSQYLTALHCAGSLPSQETGLLFNSWYGKFHLEMHWWHSVHFATWGRFASFERSLAVYHHLLASSQERAARQGYRGARWPKMLGPDGHDSPSPVGPLLLWQQPHPIYYAELCYRHAPDRATLDKWREIVFETAEFMASYAVLHEGRYVLGPPLHTVSENQDPTRVLNPTFELTYWRFGLSVAQQWRERLGMSRHQHWDDVLNLLSVLPVQDDVYLMQEGLFDTYTKYNWEHPALVGAFGMLPGDGVDAQIMQRTVKRVVSEWQWERTWGWDFPMAAMAAARVGEPGLAIDMLMHPAERNLYLPNGHKYQRPNLPAYLPGNGGLLSAVGMMAAGWTDGLDEFAPGFPKDGTWSVRFEGISPWL